ncbi:MAG: TlpA family protein disulfide reductase [Planctomycetes bacterium]|nr:TlpA family protein disulfide reductase [Planctomycetota bacterium]
MSQLAETYKDQGLVVLAVNVWDEDKSILRRFAQKNKLKQRILLEGGDVHSDYGLSLMGVPVVVWIRPDGTVADVEFGFHEPQSLERKTKKLMAGAG